MPKDKTKTNNLPETANYTPLSERTGALRYTLKNDYLFKVVFQNDKQIMGLFIAALLGVDENEITEIEVVNPIIPGHSVDNKTVVLDIRLCLNKSNKINLEMQVTGNVNWKKRSTYYLCMLYTELEKGENYINAKPARQIEIIDFDIESIKPEFYSHYKLMNVKDNQLYCDELTLSILNLKHLDKATDDDKAGKLDIWAKIFKTETWEEMKMIANESELVNRIADSIYAMTEDPRIREQCRLREERIAEEKYMFDQLDASRKELAETHAELTETHAELAETYEKLAEKDAEIAALKAQIAQLTGRQQ